MTDNTKNAVAGVAGAVVGAGVAVAATTILSDKNMRDKAKKTLTQVKDQVVEAFEQNVQIQQKGGSASRGTNKVSAKGQQKKTE